jgi:hypothetical protein
MPMRCEKKEERKRERSGRQREKVMEVRRKRQR